MYVYIQSCQLRSSLTVLDSEDVYALEEYMASFLLRLTLLLDFNNLILIKSAAALYTAGISLRN